MERGEGSMTTREVVLRSRGREKKAGTVNLPEYLQEMILARLPFPELFKIQILSKAWLAKFSSITSQDEEEREEGLPAPFQKQLVDRSFAWKTFCPLLVGKEDFVAYDRESCQWRKMPSLSFLSEKVLARQKIFWSKLALRVETLWKEEDREGALLLVSTRYKELFVANVLTRNCKQLPSPPALGLRGRLGCFWGAKLMSMSIESYKVIVFTVFSNHCVFYIYDSKFEAWRSLEIPGAFRFMSRHAYVDGVFYWVVRRRIRRNHVDRWVGSLVAFNFDGETLEEIKMPRNNPIYTNLEMEAHVDLVVCNTKLHLIVYKGRDDDGCYRDMRTILELDPELRIWDKKIWESPAAVSVGKFHHRPATDGETLFFLFEQIFVEVLTYNLQKNEWDRLRLPPSVKESHIFRPTLKKGYKWSSSSFQPCLNPFMAV